MSNEPTSILVTSPLRIRTVNATAAAGGTTCENCDQTAVAVIAIPSSAVPGSPTEFYLCRTHLAILRQDIDKTHDELRDQARSMLDHPVNNPLESWTPGSDHIAYLTRRANQRKKRNSVAGQSETIKAARQKLSAEITVDAIDELAFAWAQAVYARGGV